MYNKIKTVLEETMYTQKVTKVELAEYMGMSYPTMLNKLDNPGTLKISEADRLCRILNINFKEFLEYENK